MTIKYMCPRCKSPSTLDAEPDQADWAPVCSQCRCARIRVDAFPWENLPPLDEGDPDWRPPQFSIIDDTLRPALDNASGKTFTSKKQRDAHYKATGLQRMSVDEGVRRGIMGDHKCMRRTTSFAGQNDRRTAAERTPNH